MAGDFKCVFRPLICIYSYAREDGFVDTRRVSKAGRDGIFFYGGRTSVVVVVVVVWISTEQDPKTITVTGIVYDLGWKDSQRFC
jgi:hypothetical protein